VLAHGFEGFNSGELEQFSQTQACRSNKRFNQPKRAGDKKKLSMLLPMLLTMLPLGSKL
jgi:hypothetical protein